MSDLDAWHLPPSAPAPAVVASGAGRVARFDEAGAEALLAQLRSARPVLAACGAEERARALGRAGQRLLDPADPLRREAEDGVAREAGLSVAMAKAVIDGMARGWTAPRLLALLAAELGDPRALDEMVHRPNGGRMRAFGATLAFHVGAGTVPGVGGTSLLRSLLVGSPVLLKPGTGDVALSVLLARAIAEAAAELAPALAVVHWPQGGGGALEAAALGQADLVVAYGGDESVRALRERTSATTRFVPYHHRVSVALVGRSALAPSCIAATAADLARAVAMFDQRGCVSPHAAFVERGGAATPDEFAAALAGALDRCELELPSGPASPAAASAVHQIRRTAELRAAAGEPVRVHAGEGASWTVLVEPPAALELSCLSRTVRVHPVEDAVEVPALLGPWRRHLQTVGTAGFGDRLSDLASALGVAGASRVCPIAEVPFPPPWWHHDGQGPLRSLVRWVDLEG